MDTQSDLCNPETSALLVVDIQPTLTAAMSEEEGEQMLNHTGALLQAAGPLGIPVFLTEQYPKGLGATDQAVADHLPANAYTYEKTGFSCCAADGFDVALKESGRSQVIIVGQETHVCVLQTAFGLCHQGYQVFVVEDAVCSRKQTHKFFALERMHRANISITNYESVLFEWLRDASHPQFKNLSKLLQ